MIWDEKNMLKAIMIADHSFQHNVFSANGDRVLKGRGDLDYLAVMGEPVSNSMASIGNYTIYVGPHFVIGANGQVTKHYYSGTERIVSRLSGVAADFREGTDLSGPHIASVTASQNKEIANIFDEFGLGTVNVTNMPTDPGDCEVACTCASTLYFFHPDHLGSSSFLSDATGQAYQFLLYLPWGESMAEQKAGGWATPYKYTGKELDEEIGMYDYGARFYDPTISLWTSVDDLAAHPNQVDKSPYAYAWNNPIVYNDPDGNCPLCLVWLIAEVAMTAYDIYDAGSTLTDPNASTTDKVVTLTGVFIGGALPGAGYGTAGRTAAKAVDNATDAVKIVDNYADDVVKKASTKGTDANKVAKSDMAKESGEGVIYKVDGTNTPSGKPYIGSADDMNKRATTAKDGRDRTTNTQQIGSYEKGNKTSRKTSEQKAILDNGGVKNLDNKRNEIAPKKWDVFGLGG